jgi:flagellar L-ring protein precursor FlgH
MRTRISAIATLAAALLAGCGGVPVQEPSTAKPVVQARAPQQNGAIFQDSVSFRPLFEDRRARYVGDTLTVLINESTSASKKAELSAARDASANASVTAFPGISAGSLPRNNLAGSANTKQDTKDSTSANNAFTGTITATVIDVLPNGNLMVSGEKQVGINGEIEKLRFSGVVNPVFIVNGNQVSSSTIADARIEVGTRTKIDTEQVVGSIARFFFSFMPFR